ncbi:MAG: hypothetical protein ISS36_03775 [Candidatus Aenigmarchaeota archaeon]|nr:hypothetical protein [Candidatus Aenigmarchaeota archaeon]
MLTNVEREILTLMSGQLLITKTELAVKLSKESNGIDTSIGRLRDLGLIDKVESLGICYVITQKGIRATKDGLLSTEKQI